MDEILKSNLEAQALLSEYQQNDLLAAAALTAFAGCGPSGGETTTAAGGKPVDVRWLDILKSAWGDPRTLQPENGRIPLATPRDDGYWAALVQPRDESGPPAEGRAK